MFTTVRSLARRAAVVLGLAAAGVGLALSGTASAQSDVHAYAPTAVNGFTMVTGHQWAIENESRLSRSGFLFSSDGSFAMIQPDGYPRLVGTWTPQGTFQGTYSSSVGSTGTTSASVQGTVRFRNDGTAAVGLTYTSGSAMAARVNDTSFGSNVGKAYRATLELGQV
ncbi:hypothetical protein ACFPK1_12570 [Actinomycetospora rhizophila]|uniref:DUF3224 domain-containing protein n=1 Tax=Actinomycetospora rhizophila TaxID=1416876 RepID=A0ABV9ZBT5_9PSEU